MYLFGFYLLSFLFFSCGSHIDYTKINKDLDTQISDEEESSDVEINDPCQGVVTKSINFKDTYPEGPYFNDYLENNGEDFFSADGTVCNSDDIIDGGVNDGTTAGIHSCFHSGIMKSFELDENVCDGLILSDNLSVLNWRCVEKNNQAIFVSVGIKEDKALKDLLNSNSWKAHNITIEKDGCELYTSENQIFWENPVRDLSALSPSLGATNISGVTGLDPQSTASPVVYSLDNTSSTTGGVVYTISSDMTLPGLNIADDKVALTTLADSTLSTEPQGQNCSSSNPAPAPSNTVDCIISSYQNSYLWIAGNYKTAGTISNLGLALRETPFSRVNNINISQTSSDGIYVNSTKMRINHASIKYVGGYGLHIPSNDSIYYDISIAHAGGTAALIADTVVDTKLISLNTSSSSNGLLLGGGGNNTILNLRSTGNINRNINIYSNSNANTLVNSFLSGSNNSLDVENADQTKFFNLISILGNTSNILLGGTMGTTTFEGELLTNKSTPCDVSGIVNIDSACENTGLPSVNTINTVDLSSSFIGLITSDSIHDPIEDISSPLDNSVIKDWHAFENKFRTWQRDTGNPEILRNNGPCTSMGNFCSVWDFSLSSEDNILLNANGEFPSSSSQACPPSVHGNRTIENANSEIFLTAAREIFDDGFGDDDGLCESNERCLYLPNHGRYQGHGPLRECVFDDEAGTTNVTNIKMLGHSQNGR